MNSTSPDYIEQFNSVIRDCEVLCFMARDSELQKSACSTLQALLADCGALKAQAVAAGDENNANVLLGFECSINCLIAELSMWVLLKEERPDEAWDKLISAQTSAVDAARAHNAFGHCEILMQRLEEIEKLVFPPQVFISTGLIVRHQECSICGDEYGDCDHLAGKPYWGKLCCVIAKDIEANHIAIVENPADKRCRLINVAVNGGERNRMTWKVEPVQLDKSNLSTLSAEGGAREVVPDKALRATAVLLHSK